MDKEIKDIIKFEKEDFNSRKNFLSRVSSIITNGSNLNLYKLIYYYRKYNYYRYFSNSHILSKVYNRLYRDYCIKTNCEIYAKKIGKGFRIFHGGVIIGVNTVIKDNVKMHGHNCIGNNGKNKEEPIIGNNVNIGFGAVVIGNVELADDIIVGANAVVTKSFLEPGITIAGNPARKIK